jgi:hypothetical protein
MFEDNPNLKKTIEENEIKHVFQVLYYIKSWQEFLDVSNMIKQKEILDIQNDTEENDTDTPEDSEEEEDSEEKVKDYIEQNKKMKIGYLYNMIKLSKDQIYPLEYNRFKKGIQLSLFLFVCPNNIALKLLPHLLLEKRIHVSYLKRGGCVDNFETNKYITNKRDYTEFESEETQKYVKDYIEATSWSRSNFTDNQLIVNTKFIKSILLLVFICSCSTKNENQANAPTKLQKKVEVAILMPMSSSNAETGKRLSNLIRAGIEDSLRGNVSITIYDSATEEFINKSYNYF